MGIAPLGLNLAEAGPGCQLVGQPSQAQVTILSLQIPEILETHGAEISSQNPRAHRAPSLTPGHASCCPPGNPQAHPLLASTWLSPFPVATSLRVFQPGCSSRSLLGTRKAQKLGPECCHRHPPLALTAYSYCLPRFADPDSPQPPCGLPGGAVPEHLYPAPSSRPAKKSGAHSGWPLPSSASLALLPAASLPHLQCCLPPPVPSLYTAVSVTLHGTTLRAREQRS